ncbi:hypothetical protein VIOR103205_16005 [Vibrio ordalii]
MEFLAAFLTVILCLMGIAEKLYSWYKKSK